ncbi:hypothetical protein [Brachyspira sp.]|uniref:hypothetical protein n=1 Tax=Brachyspira sp. TaxID=1977261 RepID=UPI003D7D6AE6
MSKIKKIILIIVSFVVFILTLSIIVAILDNGNLEVDKSIISKKSELLRKNTLTFEGLLFTRGFNLDYVQNLEGPVQYVDKNNIANNVFTINFICQSTMKVTNPDIFKRQNLKAFEVAAERIKYGEIETIDYPFRMKGDDEEDYTELNFKDILAFAASSDFINGKSHLYFGVLNLKGYTDYIFTFTNVISAELILSILKGYAADEIDMMTGKPLTNKADDF